MVEAATAWAEAVAAEVESEGEAEEASAEEQAQWEWEGHCFADEARLIACAVAIEAEGFARCVCCAHRLIRRAQELESEFEDAAKPLELTRQYLDLWQGSRMLRDTSGCFAMMSPFATSVTLLSRFVAIPRPFV